MNYNMEKMKLIFGTCLDILNDIRFKYEDGKLTILELASLTCWIDDIVSIAVNIKQFKDAYLALKPEDKAELNLWFIEKFDLENEKVEIIIETIFTVIINLSSLISVMVPAPKKEVQPQETKAEPAK